MRFKSNNIFKLLLIICLLLTMAVPTWAATTGSVAISASSDDADEDGLLGNVVINSVDEPLGDYIVGMRFASVPIPDNATILGAYINFTASWTDIIACSLTFYGENAVNPASFTTGSGTFEISNRPKTGASVPWSPGNWTVDLEYPSPDLTSIVQEIVLGGWSSGNAMVFITTIGTGWRTAYSIEGGKPPELYFTYNLPPVADDESFTVIQGGTATEADLDVGTSLLDGDTDADLPGDTLTAVLDSGPSYAASFTLNADGTFSYTHNGTANFSDSFTYHANDGNDDSNIATVTITITPSNRTLNVSTVGNGTVRSVPAGAIDCGFAGTGLCNAIYSNGTNATLEAFPENGWTFNRWEDGVGTPLSTDNPYTFLMDADKTVIAIFDHTGPHTITATPPFAGGTITPSGAVSVPLGGSQGFTMTPYDGYVVTDVWIDFWTTPLGPVSSYTFVNVTADNTIDAQFDLDTANYGNIWAWAPPGGSIQNPGDKAWLIGSQPSYDYTPDTGYEVIGLDVFIDDGTGWITPGFNPAGGTYTFDPLPAGWHTINVNFNPLPGYANINAWAWAGGSIQNQGDKAWLINSQPTYDYTPNPGFQVSQLEVFLDDGTGWIYPGFNPAGGTYTFDPLPAGWHSINAQFVLVADHTIWVNSISPPEYGSISPSGEVGVATGNTQAFIITPAPGYHLLNLSLDGVPLGPVASPYTTPPVTQDHTIDVEFARTTYIITPSAGPGGSILPSGPVAVNHGENQDFAITPDAGYHVDSVLVDGLPALPAIDPAGGTHSFINVQSNHSITVTFVNDPPVANNDTADALDEGGTITTVDGGQASVLHDDIDPESAPLTAVLDTGPTYASSFALNADGTFSYTHNNSENLSDSFTYHANDGVNDGNVATVTITMNPVNDNIPVSGDDTADAVDEGGTVTTVDTGQTSVLHDDTDADMPGDTLTAVLDTGPSYAASFALNADGTFSYTHDNSENLSDIFTYHVNDGVNDGNVATVTITMNPVNDNIPVAGDDTADAVDEGGTVTTVDTGQTSVLHDDTDADLPGDTLTAVLDTGPSYAASFALNADGTFSYTHDNSENLSDSFTYHVNDGVNDGNVATVTITMNPVNDNLPVAGDDTADAVDEGGTVTTVDTGQTSVLHDDTDADMPGDTLTAVLDSGPSYAASFALNADGTFTYTHDNSENLSDSFTYHVNDGVNDGNVATVTITMNPVNDNIPVSGDDTADAVDEGGTVTTVDTGQTSVLHDDTDADMPGDTLTAVLDTGPSYAASFSLNADGTFSYTHDNSENFIDIFTYHVNDGVNDGNVATVTITMNPVNDNLPVAGDDTADAVDEGGIVTTVDTGQTSVLHDDTDADMPGDTLTAVLDSGPSYAASFALNADGTFSYTHDNSENLADSFTYHVNDGVNNSVAATVTIAITPINDNIPVANDDTADALDEGGTVTTVDGTQTSVLYDDTDADLPGDTLTAVLDTGPSYAAAFALNADGTFSYTHDNSENLADSFTYHVNDGVNDGNVATVTITMNPVNDNIPVAGDDTADAVDEGGTVTTVDTGQTSVLHDDTDADLPGDTLTAVLDTGPSYAAAFALNADGTFSYTHDNSENLADSFTYHVNDGVNNSVAATVTIAITPINDNIPVANDDTADALDEGGTVTTVDGTQTSVLYDDTDADLPGDTLTAVLDTGPSYAAAFALNADGTFSYTHDNSENLADSFTYHVNDGVNDSIAATVTIAITPVNDNIPVANDDTADALDEGGTVTTVDGTQTSVLYDDTDADLPGDTLTAVLDTGPSYAAAFALNADGTFSYTHDNSENFADSFTYHVNDGVNNSVAATVTIAITPVNDNIPVANDDTADALDEGGTVTTVDGTQTSVLYDDTDADLPGDTLTAVLDTGPSYAASFALNADGTFSYTHDNSENFADSFTYHVNDGVNDSVAATVTIAITPVNDNIPVANDDITDPVDEGGTVTTVDGTQTSVLYDDTDADLPGDTLTAVLDTGPSYAAAFALNADGTFSYTHDNSENFADSFTYHVNDGVNDSVAATVTIAITPVNDNIPVANDDITDPVDEGGTVTTVDGTQTSVLYDDTDADLPGDTLTAVLDTGPSYAAAFALNADGTFSYTHDNSENFADSFTYHVNDGVNDSVAATVTIAITPVNDNIPVANDDTADALDEGGTVTTVDGTQTSVLYDDTDADLPGDTLTAVLDTGPSYAAAFALNADGTFSYTHDNSENLADSFTYHVNDGVNNSVAATVTIAITPVNDNIPVANDDTADALDEGGTVTTVDGTQTSVLYDDTDADLPGDTLTAVLDTGPSYAAAFALNADGTFSYTHDNSENFADSFTYHVNDGVNDSVAATVTIAITPVNDNIPVANDDTADALDEGGTVTTVDGTQTSVLHDDTDADLPGDTLTAVLDTGPSYAAAFALNADGTFSYTHDNSENLSDSFTYHVNDGVYDGNVATVTITMNPVNDNIPVSGDDTADAVDEGGTVTTVDTGQTSVLHDDTDADMPGDTLTAVLDTGPSYAASFALNADGTFSYTHDNSENLSDSFTYHVNDGVNDGNVATVTITMNPVNDNIPVAGDDTADAVDEGGTVTTVDTGQTSVLHDDTDADLPGDILTAVLDTGPSYAASFALNADGTFSYTHDNSENLSDSFTYHVNDGVNDGNVATVTITMNPVNDNLPVAGDDTADAVDEGGTVTTVDTGQTSVLHDDTDADLPGDTLTAVLDTGPSYAASFALNADGTFSYTHDNSENLSDSFTYHVNDGVNDGNVATVTITMNPVNDNIPVSGDDTADAVDEGGTVTTVDTGQTSVLHDDTDADLPGDTLTAVLDTGPSYAAAFALNGDGTFSYTHDDSENLADSFTYHVNDGVNDGNVATVTISMNPVNDNTPVANDDTADAVAEGATVTTVDTGQTSVLHDDTDADMPGDTLTAVLDTGPAYEQGSFFLNGDGTFSYTHDGTENFLDSFTYHVNDGVNDSNVATVTVIIDVINDPPAFDSDPWAFSVDENALGAAVGTVTATDPENNGLTYSISGADSASFLIDSLSGVITTAVALDFETDSSYSFTVTVTDDGVGPPNLTDTATVNVTVNDVNEAPVGVDDSGATDEDTFLTIAVPGVLYNDTDVDAGATLSVSGFDSTSVSGASVTVNADGSYTYNPTVSATLQALAAGATTADTFNYTVSDGSLSDTATVTITVSGLNDAPVAVDDTNTTDEETVLNMTAIADRVLFNDSDVDTADTFTVTSFDATSTNGANVTVNADGSYNYDPTVSAALQALAVTESIDDTFTYTITDSQSATDTATVTITVTGVNDGPTANDDPVSTDEDTAATFLILANDSDIDASDTLTIISLDTTGTIGLVTNNILNVTYDPNGQFDYLAVGESATDTFTYIMSDGNGGTDTATVTVTINGVNDAPVAVDDSATTDEDTAFTTGDLVAANDSDPDSSDTLAVTGIDTTGTIGSVTDNTDGTFGYDPNGQFEFLAVGESTTDTFIYTISDGNGGTDTATVTVTITGVNDAPVANDDFPITDEDTITTTPAPGVLSNDTDVDTTDTLTVTTTGTVTTANGALATLNADGSASYDPNGQFEYLAVGESTTDSIAYTISDGNGGTDTATITVTITGVNDGPVAVDDSATTDEDTPFTTGNLVAANDTDPDGSDILTVIGIDTTGTIGSVTDNTDGTFGYDPNGQFEYLAVGESTTDTFIYTISDGNGGTDTATVTVTITGVNDAPTAVADSDTTSEDGPAVSIDLTVNDTDPDTSDDLEIQSVDTTGTLGSVTIEADNDTVTYDPNGQFEALAAGDSMNDTFTYTITDGNGGTDTALVTVTITGVNDGPVAGFSGTPTIGTEPLTVTFTDLSTDVDTDDIVGWDWDFGDGVGTSVAPSPTYIYNSGASPTSNSYTVTLTVTDAQGVTDTFTLIDYITVDDTDPTAGFTAAPIDGDEKLSVSFTDTTTTYDGVSWSWDLGDGNTSTEESPSHLYDQNGVYNVTLTVTEADGDTNVTPATTITVYETGPTANFSVDETSGPEPLLVTFTDSSTSNDGIITWDWNYQDGEPNGTAQNPTHTFSQQGSYSVILTVSEDAADGSLTSDAYQLTISVDDTGPTADFTPSPGNSGNIPLAITFADTSVAYDGVVSWIWDFDNGGGTTDSFEQNPSFTFNQAGTFNVCLTVEDPDGDTDTACAIILAQVPGVDTDTDGDGWWLSQGDCNDNDASINPGAFDICGDGIDQDCFDGDRVCPPAGEGCCEISNEPLDVKLDVATPNIMIVLDDSGSMDWEFMTTDGDDGKMWIDGSNYEYLNDISDNVYSSDTLADDGDPEDKTIWKTRWANYNAIYYNPDLQYDPWHGENNANTDTPRSHPMVATPTFNLNNIYFTLDSSTAGIIVDEDDSGFTMTGSWDNDWDNGVYDHRHEVADSNGDYTATWTPDAIPEGDYEVYAYWDQRNGNSSSVVYTINGSAGSLAAAPVNQRTDGDQWNRLALADGTDTFHFDENSGSVSLSFTVSGYGTYVSADAVKFVPTGIIDVDVINAHYYVWSNSQNKAYLVNLNGSIQYYAVTTSGDFVISLVEKTGTDIPADVQFGRTYAEERQNFANWFSFYRRRWLTAVAALSHVIPELEGVNFGWRSINGNSVQPVLPVKVPGETDNADALVLKLKNFRPVRNPGSTPLRNGLKMVGLYYHMTETTGSLENELKVSPITTDEGGACQQNFALIISDGSWNGGAPGFTNEDGDNGVPYADDYPNTLADVAMYFYENDLAPAVADEVPTNFYDKATWQHMVTYGITFGVNGQLDPADYDLYNVVVSDRVYPTWASPLGSDSAAKQAKIDDVWHSAVNARGKYLSASNPQELVAYLNDIIDNIVSRIGSGSSVSVNGEELDAGLVIYQALYNTDGWIGDVKAHRIDTTTGAVIRDSYVWSAEEELYSQNWDTGRLIATYDGNQGQRFRYNYLNSGQQSSLDGNATTAANMVNYLRGDDSNEQKNGGGFRNRIFKYPDESTRSSKLGDIVHSSPFYQKYINETTQAEYGLIYVGGNDGMLHAFDADLGYERFAYVPNLVFENLKLLTAPGYQHKYYVDVTPYVKNAGGTALLVGGLGKGGKGYFCLDVSDPSSIVFESDVADMVQWEFPNSSTVNTDVLDMGYSFSRAFIAKSNYTGYPWLTIFGNGYSSPNEKAVLFILDAYTGDVVKKIDTGVGGGGICNGLSTPVLIDVDNNQTADYVYAGDLMGNMWKFDISDPSPINWDVAYRNSVSGNPEPLFTAKDDAGNVQPITAKPDVMRPCTLELPGYFVIFGTGKYLGYTDFSTTGTQTLYGISDYGDDDDNTEYLGAFNRGSTPQLSNQPNTVTLQEQTQIFYDNQYTYVDEFGATITVTLPNYIRVLSDNPMTYNVMDDPDGGGENPDLSDTVPNNAGWYFDFPITKERMVRDLLIRSGKVIFISSIPTSTACSAGGESILHESNACTGGRLNSPQLDINNDGVIDESDLINIGGEWMAPTGMHYPTMLYPPSIVPADEDEVKLMSTSSGQIIDVRETSERAGIIYWQQLDQ